MIGAQAGVPHINVAAFCESVLEEKSNSTSLIRMFSFIQTSKVDPDARPKQDVNLTPYLMLRSYDPVIEGPLQMRHVRPDGEVDEWKTIIDLQLTEDQEQAVVISVRLWPYPEGPHWFEFRFNDQILMRLPLHVAFSGVGIDDQQSETNSGVKQGQT